MATGTGGERRWRPSTKGPEMLKYLFGAVALVLAGVPAYLGLTSNASFSRDVPVRVPEQAQVVTPTQAPATRHGDDDGTPDQGRGDRPRDDRTEAVEDRGDDHFDDHGGDRPRDDRTEAGDDHGGDSHGGSGHGSDDGPDDGSGHGSGHD
jgi:hypothetical protein